MLSFFSEFIDESTRIDTGLEIYYQDYKNKLSLTDDVIENIMNKMKEEEILREKQE